MPTDKRRFSLTVLDDRAVRVLGYDPDPREDGTHAFGTTQAWAALARYANLVERAGRELERRLTREEWCLIADVNNGCADLWDFSGTDLPPLLMVTANVEDGQRLDGAGDKWFGEGKGDAGTNALVGKLRQLTPLHGEALAAAVRFFWSRPDLGTDDKWWTVAARAPRREAVS